MNPVNPAPDELDRMLEDLEELVTCESPSSDLPSVARSGIVVGDVGARSLGVQPEIITIEGRTHLRWRFGAGDRALLLGHHDTVHPLGTVDEHPFRVEDGTAYGPGCFDMKAGLVQMFHAVAALPDRDGLTLLVTGDEEVGSPTSRTLIEQEARHAGIALVLEASADGGALKTARKGVSLYEVVVTGRAAHAGLEPHSGVNTTVAVAEVVLALAALDEGPGSNTVTPTLLASGVAGNTVPAHASLRVDVRSLTAADQARLDRAVLAVSTTVPGARVEVRCLAERPPMDPRSCEALLALAQEVAAERGLAPLTHVHVGGGSDGNLAAGVGALVLDGLGAVGGGAHAPGEHVVVAAMPERTRLLTGVLERLVASPGRWSQRTEDGARIGVDRR